MNKPKYAKIILCCVISTIGVWYGLAQSQPVLGAQSKTLAVGRDNPFAEIPRVIQPASPRVVQSLEPVEEAPELFVQTIMLKFLDAESLQEAIGNMSSQYGTIVTNKKNNSLIVCDTKEHLEKIFSEIKKADKTPRQIMVEVVIVDVQLDDDTKIGINWDILSDKDYDINYRQALTAATDRISVGTGFISTGLGGGICFQYNACAQRDQFQNAPLLSLSFREVPSGL